MTLLALIFGITALALFVAYDAARSRATTLYADAQAYQEATETYVDALEQHASYLRACSAYDRACRAGNMLTMRAIDETERMTMEGENVP